MRRPCPLGAVGRAYWLYDLRAGEGTGQGQRPGPDVQRLRRQEDIETCFLNSTPATVDGGELAACPLARLRDVGQAGVHTHHNSGVKRSVSVSEYIYADYPLPPFQRFVQGLGTVHKLLSHLSGMIV